MHGCLQPLCSLTTASIEWGYTHERVLKSSKNSLSVAYLVNNAINEGCCRVGGASFAVGCWYQFRNERLVMLTATRSLCRAVADVRPFLWRRSQQYRRLMTKFNRQPLRQRGVPCPRGRVYLKRFSQETPVEDRYLADRTQDRTADGRKHHSTGWASGVVYCSSRRRQLLHSLRLLRTGHAPRSLVI
jgi:hypothetical protein